MALRKEDLQTVEDIDVSHIPKEDRPISQYQLHGKRRFLGLFAGEHVAGTEFVIGATFVMWGVAASDVIIGLIFGNLLAVLTWALFTAPIATDTRLTLYTYLKKISGPTMQKIYNAINGIFFCIIGGAMVTVSASAVREILNIPIQTTWYPTSLSFIAIVLAIGTIVAVVAAFGFKSVTQFSSICAPWLGVVFVSGALVGLYYLIGASTSVTGLNSMSDFMILANESVWVSNPESQFTFYHVIAFAWIANLAMHGGMSDMAIFRYAKKARYGFISAVGMFFGHYVAWICAGIMGATAAVILSTSLTQLDAGAVAYNVLGVTGVIAVIIAGWTTSNPTIYRAGLAFQTIFSKHSVKTVTLATGALITLIACFPFVFTNLLDVVGFMGMILLPVGAIIVTEHWIFPKLGFTRYWASYKKLHLNKPALSSWIISALFVIVMTMTQVIHVYFLAVPTWLIASVSYIYLAGKAGAKEKYPMEEREEKLIQEKLTKEQDRDALLEVEAQVTTEKKFSSLFSVTALLAGGSIITLLVSSFMVFSGSLNIDIYKIIALVSTVAYFVFATYWTKKV
ncbi:purine-cytosine permease family protein [Salipaludibacillus sp. CF4.18]|uniref:purine-cytosine permease family protein n=1 Tax=Salipaludibacillus sp. CF4.18 TaxID=3373081 RepID=UPI003EE56E8C